MHEFFLLTAFSQISSTVRELEEDAKEDEEIAALLEGTGGDPDMIKRKVVFGHPAADTCRA